MYLQSKQSVQKFGVCGRGGHDMSFDERAGDVSQVRGRYHLLFLTHFPALLVPRQLGMLTRT